MKAIIMAGGRGTRLQAISGGLPKPMMPLCGRPILEHIIRLLAAQGFQELCLTLGYKPEVIRDHFGDGQDFGVKLRFHTESQPLGTAGGVRACADFYGQDDFLVISGDAACDFDLARLMAHRRETRCTAALGLYRHPEPLRFGLVPATEDGRILNFLEKPGWDRVVTDLINTGIYALSPAAMAPVPPDRPYDFGKDLFPQLLRQGEPLHGLALEGYWCDIGTPRDYYQCNLDALEGRLRLPIPPESAPEPQAEAPRRNPLSPLSRVSRLPCRERARIMGILSLSLAELGAELTDGLCLATPDGRLRISPDPGAEALIIEADAADPKAAQALADRWTGHISGLLDNL